MNLYSSSIGYSKILKRTQMSFNGWMVEQIFVHPCNGLLLRNKKEWSTDTYNNLNGHQRLYVYWKKSISNVYMLYYSIYVIFIKWQNCRDAERGKRKEVGDTTEVTWESSFMMMEQFCIFILVIVTWIYTWDKTA